MHFQLWQQPAGSVCSGSVGLVSSGGTVGVVGSVTVSLGGSVGFVSSVGGGSVVGGVVVGGTVGVVDGVVGCVSFSVLGLDSSVGTVVDTFSFLPG